MRNYKNTNNEVYGFYMFFYALRQEENKNKN